MLSWLQNSIKLDPTSFKKQLSKPCPNLDGFLGQHTSIFGGFWVPSWTQNPKKIDLGPIKKLIKKLTPLGTPKNQFFVNFRLQDGGPWGGKTFRLEVLFCSWVGLGAKMAPRSPQDPPRPLPSLIFMDFGPQLADFLTIFLLFFINFLMFFG